MLSSMVDHAGIGEYLTDIISADEVETFELSVELYRHAAARTEITESGEDFGYSLHERRKTNI